MGNVGLMRIITRTYLWQMQNSVDMDFQKIVGPLLVRMMNHQSGGRETVFFQHQTFRFFHQDRSINVRGHRDLTQRNMQIFIVDLRYFGLRNSQETLGFMVDLLNWPDGLNQLLTLGPLLDFILLLVNHWGYNPIISESLGNPASLARVTCGCGDIVTQAPDPSWSDRFL